MPSSSSDSLGDDVGHVGGPGEESAPRIARCPAARRSPAGCDRRGGDRSARGRARRSERTAPAAPPTAALRSGRRRPYLGRSGNRPARPLSPGRSGRRSPLAVSLHRRAPIRGYRRRRAWRQMPVQARASDPRLVHDLCDRSPWSRRCAAYASLSGSTSTGRPTRRPFAVATARACAARSIVVGELHLREQRQQHDRELRRRILGIARVDLDRIGQVAHPDPALGTAHGSCSACRGPSGRGGQACAR
jgi:hypothetical protein